MNRWYILYSSDIGALKTNNHYLNNTEIDTRGYRYVIMESTYGLKGRINKKTRSFDLEHLRVAANTVLERGGTLLMPCFSFSRTQQILTSLYELFGNDSSFKYDIIVDSMLSCEISNLYDELLEADNLLLWKKVKAWKNVKFITEKDESIAIVKGHQPKIVISSSGFCTNGRILSYLHEYLSDEKSMVVFSGYVGDNNNKENKILKISGDQVENKCDCITLTTFSSHANRNDLIEYGSNLNTEKLILVHGSTEAKNSLKEDLKEAISKNNKTHKVLCASKDMYLKL